MKQDLKWFLIRRLCILLAGMYLGGELINLFYALVGFPLLNHVLSILDIRVVSGGGGVVYLLQMLCYFLADFLPPGIAVWVKQRLHVGLWGLQISIGAPFAAGWHGIVRLGLLCILLLMLALRLLPYLAGAYVYSRTVAGKVRELLEEEKARQQAFERQRSLLLSDIAHDIKTPITAICGYSRALSEGLVEEEKRQAYLDALCRTSMRMDELLTLLFDYVKLDSEGFALRLAPGDLAELLREMTALSYGAFEDRGMQLATEIPEEAVYCSMDRLQMGRAITNLLGNAARYGRAGGRVLVRLCEGEITVADDGDPIAPDFAARIFDPFTREDKARSSLGGSGLGLSIAKKIVEMHGGELVLNQKFGEGYGKAFQIRLPAGESMEE